MFSLLSSTNEWTLALLINSLLIVVFSGLPILTRQGWFHAGALGTILWGCLGWEGWFSVVIYLVLGSLVTRIGYSYKKNIGVEESRGGRRGPENIWGSAFTGTVLAILIKLGIGPSSVLQIGFAASFSAKLADTFGSEIGKRFGKKTRLISTLRSVPPGTDGAISLEGTFASILGSFIMSFVMYNLNILDNNLALLIVIISGIIATLIESLIGAFAQNNSPLLTNEVVNSIQTTFSSAIAMTLIMILN